MTKKDSVATKDSAETSSKPEPEPEPEPQPESSEPEPESESGERSGAGAEVDAAGASVNIEQILDVEVTVVVRFGKVEMPLNDVAQLAPGSVIELDREPEQPVELLVNDRVFATGEVVVADGNYALRIERILSQADRIRSLGS